MTWSDRRFVAAAGHKSYARALHARTDFSVCAWSAQACGLRAAVAAKRWFDRVIAQRFTNVAR
eukprot:2416074-Lingulodinium_polyedra.AAC.1